tara:strand:- start:55 stop:456 length:402 start_codon:yes stop_codon:yes gene_type:complete
VIAVDTSAILSVLFAEDDAEQMKAALAGDENPVVSAPTYLGARIVLGGRIGILAQEKVDAFLASANVEVMEFNKGQATIAAAAWQRYGRGSGSPAKLNFGDCFSYALAQFLAVPLLYKGDDFSATDVTAALSA